MRRYYERKPRKDPTKGNNVINISISLKGIGLKPSQSRVHKVAIQLKKNFSNLSYPVLTTTQNDEKLHTFDSSSLVILSVWAYYAWRDMYR